MKDTIKKNQTAATLDETTAHISFNPNVSEQELLPDNTPGEHAVRTWNWKMYGNNTPNGLAAAKEAINNAIQYAILGRDVLHVSGPARVDVNIFTKDGDTYLEVLNSGAPANLIKMMHYGNSPQHSQLSQYGTGNKTFFSYFSPDSECGVVYTKSNGRYAFISLPYGEKMKVQRCAAKDWPFEKWVVTCVRVKVDNPERLETITADALGKDYAPLIRAGINLFFNGTQVFAISPIGDKTAGSKEVTIPGTNATARVDMMHYYLSEDTAHPMFPVGLEPHGVYVYANGVFATHEGVSVFFKTPRCTKTTMTNHPYYNRLVTIINITTPANHQGDVLFDSNKTKIKWDEGCCPLYRQAINELASEFYREEYRRRSEAARGNLYDAVIASAMKRRPGGIIKQFPCNKMKRKDAGSLFADTAICSGTLPNGKPDPNTVDTIYEYKPEVFTSKHVGVVWNYWRAIKHHYGVKPALVFIGEEFEEEAILAINDLADMGIDVEIIESNKDKLFHR